MNDAASLDSIAARFCTATESGDIDAAVACFAEDGEIVSPLSNRMRFRGRDAVRLVLGAVFQALTNIRWTYITDIREGRCVACGSASIFGIRMEDAAVIDITPEGSIARFQPHQRPWLALTLIAVRTLPAMIRQPGAVYRALTQH